MEHVNRLQEGIYFDKGSRPGAFFNMVFLRAEGGRSATEVGTLLGRLWLVLRDLTTGDVPDLPGHPVPSANLTVLIGYGMKAFALPGARRELPSNLGPAFRFRSALPPGGPLLRGSGLRYADDIRDNPATEEILLQFIADSQLAAHRAVLETWKVLFDAADPETGAGPLIITGVFSGFQRDDGRSWIDFHDGVSNLVSGEERRNVLAVKPENAPEPKDAWTVGGTYLAFIRLALDLPAWRRMSREDQERLVGRDKLSGCAITRIGGDGHVVAPGCPAAGSEVIEPGNEQFREPPRTDDPVVRLSHVQRANQHVTPPEHPNSLRVYRQGYEFLEGGPAAGQFRAGLNFVSFQDTPQRLIRILVQDGWLGRTNFGGDPDAQPPGLGSFLTVRAAGIYLVPPLVAGEAFPGSSIFQ